MAVEKPEAAHEGPAMELSQRVMVVSMGYPPVLGGSSIIMRNLLAQFPPGSIVLATMRPWPDEKDPAHDSPHRRHFVMDDTHLPGRWENLRRLALRPVLTHRLVRLGRSSGAGAIVGVYPRLSFLDAAQRAAVTLRLPFFPYLHDTIVEALSSSRLAAYAQLVQRRVFSSATAVFVATHGMAELYERKYGLHAHRLVHIYPEEVRDEPPADPPASRSLLWSGGVYTINAVSLQRVNEAMGGLPGVRFAMATGQSREELTVAGLTTDTLDVTFVPMTERQRYLEFLGQHAVLVLALNWPDETHVHEDELSTIFPTKTPEYLASGRPILVHCPEHYHLARFFNDNDCGLVVSERSPEALRAALGKLLDDRDVGWRLGRNALRVARQFNSDRVSSAFRDTIEQSLRSHRSRRSDSLSNARSAGNA